MGTEGIVAPRHDSVSPRFVTGDQHAEVSVIIVTYQSASDIASLIGDLRLVAARHRIRVIVVDNESSDGTVSIVRRHDDIILVESGGNIGYAGGINAARPEIGECDNVLILNPDVSLSEGSVARLLDTAAGPTIGAVVPLILEEDGSLNLCIHREPSIVGSLGDALLGAKVRPRPSWTSEVELSTEKYSRPHNIDWAVGAAVMIPTTIFRDVGPWNEDFFLYSEEVDFYRRIRETGRDIRYDPVAVVRHRRGGSGQSEALAALKAVNRIRYIEMYHGPVYSAVFRATVAVAEALRSYDASHRRRLGIILRRRTWKHLPSGTKRSAITGPLQRGSVIVPAHNESATIGRVLEPLSELATKGYIELIVACNGSTDATADIARAVPGVRVTELRQASKPDALNAGDEAASLWPRLYVDADVEISPSAVLEVLDRLRPGDVLAASPDSEYDSTDANWIVSGYYRVRNRISEKHPALWWAGAYALNEMGHARFGRFPSVTNDDLFVDSQFQSHEKAIVHTAATTRKTPTNASSLLGVLRRHHRGGVELVALPGGAATTAPELTGSAKETLQSVLETVRGPLSAIDAAIYLCFAMAKRLRYRRTTEWERDDSSRATS